MGLSDIYGRPAVAATLIGIGLLYLVWVWVGSMPRDKREGPEVLLDMVSLPAGGFAVVVAVVNVLHTFVTVFTAAVLAGGAVGLIARALHNVPWSAIIALTVGTAAGVALWVLLPWVPGYAFIVVGFVVFMLLYIPLHAAQGVFDVISFVLKLRILLALAGLAMIAEGALVALGLSLASIG